jgi:hypothetical protein
MFNIIEYTVTKLSHTYIDLTNALKKWQATLKHVTNIEKDLSLLKKKEIKIAQRGKKSFSKILHLFQEYLFAIRLCASSLTLNGPTSSKAP